MRTLKWHKCYVPAGGEYVYPAYVCRCGSIQFGIFRTPFRDFRWGLKCRPFNPKLTPQSRWKDEFVAQRLDECKNRCEAFADPLIVAMSEVAL